VIDNAVFLGRVDAVRVAEFQSWERRVGGPMAARQQIVPSGAAFDLRDDDVLDRQADVREDAGVLVNLRTGHHVARDEDRNMVARLLGAIDGRSSYGEVLRSIAQPQREAASALCHRLLGPVIVVPATVERLERRLALAQVVRFPQQSPYAVPRPYWENSIAVRHALPALYDSAASADRFAEALCGLHRLATLGEDGRNFYGAASGMPTVPGELRQGPVRTWVTRGVLHTLARWLDALGVQETIVRAGAPPATDHAPLIDLLDDGSTCVHRGGAESIRTALEDVRQQLLAALRARERSARDTMIASCARMHQLICAVHPFANVNNSIAMNVVNDLLSSDGGRGVPHLFLDYLALRMTASGYAMAFAAVFASASDPSSELLRIATLEHWPSFKALRGPGRGA
jgi:hypothetical protein